LAEDQGAVRESACIAVSKRGSGSLPITRLDAIRGRSFFAVSGETQHFACDGGVSRTMCDQDDARALVGGAVVSRVHDPVGPPIPEPCQVTCDREPVPSAVTS